MNITWNNLFSQFTDKLDQFAEALNSPEFMMSLLYKGVLSLLVIAFTLGVRFLLKRLLSGYLERMRFARWLINLIIVVTAVLGLFQIWGVNVAAFFRSPLGARIIIVGLTFIFVSVTGLVVWHVVNSYLDKKMEALQEDPEASRRLLTILPLLRHITRMIILGVGILIFLPALGINIAPLLAGAGIVGVAIGFGSQSLVKDVITGFFVLAEDVIHTGDWVILGGHDGQVEGLTIRHVRLRDIYGNLHTVPWGTVGSITNQTKEFGYAVVEPGVAYRENIDEVIEVVKEVAREMQEDPALKNDILGNLQILGLIELGDSAVVVRTRFKTSPFRRWFLERDFRRRLKNRFDELGIEIPYPHSTIYFGEDKKGEAPPARVHISHQDKDGEES
ncbi:MAG: mechanosensitive ion channel family protein [Desulfurivibrionaceae bacterium]